MTSDFSFDCAYNSTAIILNISKMESVLNGTNCIFNCSLDFNLEGPSDVTCIENKWDKTFPTCKIKGKTKNCFDN